MTSIYGIEIMTRADDDRGKAYPTADFIDAIESESGMAGTQEVADYVGCSYETAYKRLTGLEELGKINSRRVANARLWMVND